MPNQDIINIAIIGCGSMGQLHAKAFTESYQGRIGALCDIDETRLARADRTLQLGPSRLFTDYQQLLEAAKDLNLQAAVVAVPNHLHAPITISALKAGLHVLCEIPMATSAAESHKMVEAAKTAKRVLMINFSSRFQPQIQALKQLVSSGAVGQIYFGRTIWHRRLAPAGFTGWAVTKQLSGGGPLLDLGMHRLDLAMWLMNNPRPVSVTGSTFNLIGSALATRQNSIFDVEDLGCAMIRFDNGSTLILEASWAGFTEKREDILIQLFGTRGGIIQRNLLESQELDVHVYSEENGCLWDRRLQQCTAAVPTVHEEFISSMLAKRESSCPGQHGLDVQLILDAIYKSASTGKEIALPKASE